MKRASCATGSADPNTRVVVVPAAIRWLHHSLPTTRLCKRFVGESGFSREAIVVKPFKKLAASVASYRVDFEEVKVGIDKPLQN